MTQIQLKLDLNYLMTASSLASDGNEKNFLVGE
jgi:hypothetical protein